MPDQCRVIGSPRDRRKTLAGVRLGQVVTHDVIYGKESKKQDDISNGD